MRDRRLKVYPFDYLIIGYCLLMVLCCAAFGRPLSEYIDEIEFYVSIAAVSALIVGFVDQTRSRFHLFVRLLYPAALFTLFYRVTGGTMFLIFDKFFDSHIVALETGIFGMEPTLFIDRYLLHPFWNELFSACYFSYYLMIPGFLIPIFFMHRTRIIKESLTAISLTFFVSFVMFFLYPIEGPRWHLAGQYTHTIDGSLFRSLVTTVINTAAVRGGCMPSSHVGVGLVILAYAFRVSRKLGWILLPINIGLAIGTFWGRFHYVSDVVVGALIALISVWLVTKYYDRFDRQIVTNENLPLVSKTHVA
jgi:membrane-associated phospholipid phosphatase